MVTHNMQQATRGSDRTAFFTLGGMDEGERYGVIAEFGDTEQIFTRPSTRAPRGTSPGASARSEHPRDRRGG